MRSTMMKDIRAAQAKVTQALDLALANEESIKQIKLQLFKSERTCNGLREENVRLQTQCDKQDSYSRRENLLIRGIKEQPGEDESTCVIAVKDFIVNTMNIPRGTADRMIFSRCHRVGQMNSNGAKYTRPIIIRFLDYNDRKLVWSKRFDINDRSFSVNENFANNIEHRRRLLYPILKSAKKSEKYEKAFLKGDVLVIDNVEYSFENNLSDLPADLHPKQYSYKSNENWIVFGGPHSVFNFLSNYFPHQITLFMIPLSTPINTPRQYTMVIRRQQRRSYVQSLLHWQRISVVR